MQDQPVRRVLRGQLSVAGILIGCVGCVIITASSVYTALKMGSLPWPTIFTSITALVLLRAVGRTSLNEANITQVIMSAGSMVAGGLAFTIPGVWILGAADEVSVGEMLGVALAGTLLGLVCTAVIRRRFVEESDLEYPIGTAAAETLLASRDGGATGKRLFGSMAVAGIWCVARDVLGFIPSLVGQLGVPGVAMGLQLSPMRWAVGFLAGRRSIIWWAIGAAVGWLGIVAGGTALGLADVPTAQGIVSSLGMGLMMGSGAGVVVKDVVLPLARRHVFARAHDGAGDAGSVSPLRTVLSSHGGATGASGSCGTCGEADPAAPAPTAPRGLLALMVAAAALVLGIVLRLEPAVCVVIVALSFVTAAMSAQSVGQSGIDPMEIFGLIVLLFVAAFSASTQVQLFFVAGVIAVACGLAGDVMSDFKTGQIIGTDPRVLWVGQAIGALLGTVVAVAAMVALVAAYGTDAFGTDALFVAAQANVVATMVAGVPSAPAFAAGLAAGCALYLAGIPAMMVGLGVYLPFYMSFSTVVGAVMRWVYDRVAAARGVDADAAEEAGVVVASGVLGGESIVGVIIAFASVATGLLA
ncbi:OPT/YSL family transporter [Collinsella intestinalis]|uniref:OPT/YSL family transporter n=1 Tax=Collinsella intestinalis TaxID=147207 RepID=UPI0025A3BA36|nr:OPT/YSL family transporter [Collinsella intestinalis]MDM8163546.1 OPT/YSL family transporter [Collinsella intestinalis]